MDFTKTCPNCDKSHDKVIFSVDPTSQAHGLLMKCNFCNSQEFMGWTSIEEHAKIMENNQKEIFHDRTMGSDR